ncbi:MAG: biotin transporter BioY [Candidatus Omnitrophota bacterium]|nr:biotin transporter BioY [Candidatus Omnitrophota bacterium]
MEAILNREVISHRTACRTIGVAVFVILTALGAFVRIPLPFTPVPITLQTFFVLLCGLFLRERLAALAQLSYILLGVLGLPIFTGAGSGLFYLFGPTGGYLFGFVLAALVTGCLIRFAKDSFFLTFIILSLADLILLSCGVLWLRVIFGYPLSRLLVIGFIPFLAGDLLKVLAAAVIYSRFQPRISQIFAAE